MLQVRQLRVLTLGVALVACGKSSVVPDANVASPDAEGVVVDAGPTQDEILMALCAIDGPLVELDAMNFVCPKGTWGADSLLVELDREFASQVCHDTFKPFVDGGGIRLDAGSLQACKDYVAALTCDGLVPRELTPCALVFDGQRQLSEECQLDEECPPQTYCRSKNNCGRCEPLAMELSYCSDDSECVTGFCLYGLCRRRGDVGAICDADKECLGSLVCNARVCAAAAVEGDGCDLDRQYDACGFPYSGLFCRASTATCVPERLVGESCDDYIDSACSIRGWLWCNAGVCAPPTLSGLAEPCVYPSDNVQSAKCMPGLSCQGSGMCDALLQVGAPCQKYASSVQCESPLVCINDTCTVERDAPACVAL
jgi:Dickkopf N-terminal cysteine-rich region